MKERAYLTIYRQLDEKRKTERKTDLMEKYQVGLIFIHSFCFTYLHQYNCTMYIWRFRNNLQPYLRIW